MNNKKYNSEEQQQENFSPEDLFTCNIINGVSILMRTRVEDTTAQCFEKEICQHS